jgi:hypothetical protein
LCVGIDHFTELPPLNNCIGDARAIATMMAAIPSTSAIVHLAENVDRAALFLAVEAFGRDLDTHAESLEVAFVFLASHGFQFGTKLYLATADVALMSMDAFREVTGATTERGFRSQANLAETVASGSSLALECWLHEHAACIDEIVACLRRQYSGPLALVLDACRTAPFPGLAVLPSEMINRMDYVKNTLVCLSTSVGLPASDTSASAHSPFCAALLEALFCAGVSLVSTINTACLSTGLNQRPLMASIQFHDVHLVPNFCLVVVVDFGGASFDATTLLRQLERLQTRHGLRCEDMAVVHAGAPHVDVAAQLERRGIALLSWSDASEALVDAREVDCDEVVPRLFGMWIRCCER